MAKKSSPAAPAMSADKPVPADAPRVVVLDSHGKKLGSYGAQYDPVSNTVTVTVGDTYNPDSERVVSHSVWKSIVPILSAQPYEKVAPIFEALDGEHGK